MFRFLEKFHVFIQKSRSLVHNLFSISGCLKRVRVVTCVARRANKSSSGCLVTDVGVDRKLLDGVNV